MAKKTKKKTYVTNYQVATTWLRNKLLMCNNLPNIDTTIWENMRWDTFNEEGDPIEIYQWYLTDCSDYDVDFLEQHFGLKFTYSEMLELYILCVTHWGTSWDYVYCTTDLECAERKLGEER